VSLQYVDHNLLQADERNAEAHEFLRSAARRYGLSFSKPGNPVGATCHDGRQTQPDDDQAAVEVPRDSGHPPRRIVIYEAMGYTRAA
jgi:hypothetical protein